MFSIYEVELKAGLIAGQAKQINRKLRKECIRYEECIYFDTYFDSVQTEFLKTEKELRLRKIVRDDSETVVLTYKESPFESNSKSKFEHEVFLNDFNKGCTILERLGYNKDISLEKYCINYSVMYNSVEILVTLATMKELQQDFIEVEVQTDDATKINDLFDILHDFLISLNIAVEQLTSKYYTDMIRK